MLRRKKTQPATPNLLERILSSACGKVAVVGLHPGAGSRTVVQAIADQVHRRGESIGVTRAPRAILDETDDAGETTPKLFLPEGAVVATADSLAAGEARLERLETTSCETALGPVAICRVAGEGPVPVHGPDDPASMGEILNRLRDRTGGLAVVDGAWERREFAAPDVTEAMILAVGSGYSRTPQNSAAAVRYMIDTLTVAPCTGPETAAWEEAASSGRLVVLDAGGSRIGSLPSDLEDPFPFLRDLGGEGIGVVAVPDGLHDGLLAPLVRSHLRCTLLVRDPTRLLAAPVYLKAWLKGRGRLRVARTTRPLAVATNPVNPAGEDAEPGEFRRLVSEAAATLPVHDVVLESNGTRRRPWRLWH
jgi:hypothetical protein